MVNARVDSKFWMGSQFCSGGNEESRAARTRISISFRMTSGTRARAYLDEMWVNEVPTGVDINLHEGLSRQPADRGSSWTHRAPRWCGVSCPRCPCANRTPTAASAAGPSICWGTSRNPEFIAIESSYKLRHLRDAIAAG